MQRIPDICGLQAYLVDPQPQSTRNQHGRKPYAKVVIESIKHTSSGKLRKFKSVAHAERHIRNMKLGIEP